MVRVVYTGLRSLFVHKVRSTFDTMLCLLENVTNNITTIYRISYINYDYITNMLQTGSKIVINISPSIGQAGMQELLKQVQNKNMIYVTQVRMYDIIMNHLVLCIILIAR